MSGNNVANGVLVLCALLVTGMLVRQQFYAPTEPSASGISSVDDWERLANEGHRFGGRSASLQVIEFGNYQCPFCGTADEILKRLRAEYDGEMSVVYRHYPLEPIHPHAFEAALAAECAGAQGQFPALHDALYANQDSIGIWDWNDFAEVAIIQDIPAFVSCVEDETFEARVRRDMAVADSLDMEGTPTFVVNGEMFLGAPPGETLEEFLERRIRESR